MTTTSKIKPATALPWNSSAPMAMDREMQRAITIAASNPIVGVAVMIEFGGPPSKAFDDAAYIVHAANNYPRLVQALKVLVNQVKHRGAFLPEAATGAHVNAAIVLRELGEEK